MSSSKSLFLALIVAVSHANAVFNSSSQALNRSSQALNSSSQTLNCSSQALNSSSQALNSSSQVLNSSSQALRNDPPTPSIYPLGEPCVPEWQYLNFNPKDANHKAHLEKLHDVICSGELRAVLSYGELSVKDGLAPYKRYFPLSDEEKDFQEESDYQTNVKDVLHLISEEDVGDGIIGTVVGTFVVDNFDFAANDPNEDGCNSDSRALAYTLTDQLDGREKIHFCDPAWTRGSADDVDCANLDPFPSTKMDAFSRIVIGEMTKYSSVGPASSLASQIKDVLNADGVPAHDPPRLHGLLDPAQDANEVLTEINADSYAWMSLDAYISGRCGDLFDSSNYFTQDPPAYVVEE